MSHFKTFQTENIAEIDFEHCNFPFHNVFHFKPWKKLNILLYEVMFLDTKSDEIFCCVLASKLYVVCIYTAHFNINIDYVLFNR